MGHLAALAEALVLRAARAHEQVRPFPQPHPPLKASGGQPSGMVY